MTPSSDDSVSCPYCGLLHTDLYQYSLEDGEITTVNCDCGKSFELTCYISVSFKAEACELYDLDYQPDWTRNPQISTHFTRTKGMYVTDDGRINLKVSSWTLPTISTKMMDELVLVDGIWIKSAELPKYPELYQVRDT